MANTTARFTAGQHGLDDAAQQGSQKLADAHVIMSMKQGCLGLMESPFTKKSYLSGRLQKEQTI
jgi:hypothetical protein